MGGGGADDTIPIPETGGGGGGAIGMGAALAGCDGGGGASANSWCGLSVCERGFCCAISLSENSKSQIYSINPDSSKATIINKYTLKVY